MNKKLYQDMDSNTYQSLNKILNYDKGRLINIPTRRRAVLEEELDSIGDINNIRLIKYLLILCFDKDMMIASKALNHLKIIITGLTINEFLFFAEFFRKNYRSYSIDYDMEKDYREADNYNLDLVSRFGEDSVYLLSILSLHPSGQLREKALKRLCKINNPFKFRFILIRLNDWVVEIRKIAKMEIVKSIKCKHLVLEEIIECLPIIDRMKNWGRGNHSTTLHKLENFIMKQTNYDLLLTIYNNSSERLVKRKLFNYLIEIDTSFELINIGLRSNDILILRATIKEIDNILNMDNAKVILDLLVKNKHVVCRVAAIDILMRTRSNNDLGKAINPFIYDKSFAVRDYARYTLKKIGITEFRGKYVDEIKKTNHNLYSVISGIRETGEQEDIKYVIEYLEHENIRIRKTALTTICHLSPKEAFQYAIDKLLCENMSESNNAKKCIENLSQPIDENMMYEIFELDGFEEHVYINLIFLMRLYSKWVRIIQLLKILKISSSNYTRKINEEIYDWVCKFNHSFIVPREEQIEDINKLIIELDDKLSQGNRINMRELIDRI